MKPLLAITMGDVNGVGPEILAKALGRDAFSAGARVVVYGDSAILAQAAKRVGISIESGTLPSLDAMSHGGGVAILESNVPAPEYRPGTLDGDAGRCAMEWFELAVRDAMAGHVDGVVTCPINKEGIRLAGYRWDGHTDFLAALTGTTDYRMSLFAGSMRVVHLTGHMSLRDALDHIKQDAVATSIRLGAQALERLGTDRRHIAVAGLNPHAGEAGAFGREEIDEIAPAIAQCRADGIDCSGPHSPDTVFRRMQLGEFDLVVAMYHDQGHIPMKLIAMEDGVNVTLGVPIVRTSVDHGTAYDIAGTGRASEQSLIRAVELASRLARNPAETSV